ncbi:MAG: ABC transporter ATP-binding protein [bacterium]
MVAVLETRGLRKHYGDVRALDGIDLRVEPGEIFGFLGPNGAGKTTFTKCVTGFVRPTAGTVTVAGIDALQHPTQVAHHVGLVPDQYDFYSNLTGRQHLDFYGRLLGMHAEVRKARIDEVLGLVRMVERADTRVKTYSHGMKQRICIAQAILHKPRLILFDEPTNGLDPKGAYELRELIKSLAKDGTTVFLNSHQLSEVEQVCNRVAILRRGQLVTVSTVNELRRQAGKTGGAVQVRLLNPANKFVTLVGRFATGTPSLNGDVLQFVADDEATAAAVAALAAAGAKIAAVTPTSSALEAAFLEITDREGSL